MLKNAYTHHCSRRFTLIHILIVCFLIAVPCYSSNVERVTPNSQFVIQPSNSVVPIGLVLDANSPLGTMLNLCIQMALSDTYLKYPNFTTVMQLHTRNAQSVLDANFAVEDLLKHERVKAIIGPQGYTQDVYFSELGQKFNVPMLSTTARSSSPSSAAAQNSFFLRITMDDVIQARALAALCQEFQWPRAVLLYEDTEYGHRFESYLIDSFRDAGIGIVLPTAIPLSANQKHLSKLLTTLNQQETKVFLVHTNPSLGFRLFEVAKNAWMMREGSAWIVTDSMSNFMSSMDSATRESMEGVVAVRPYVPPSNKLNYFQERFERNSSRASMDLNVYGLWAYDAITALAVAVESIGPATVNLCVDDVAREYTISSYGSRLLRELSNMRFRGLSGNFKLVGGTMKPSDFEIVNLIGTGERRIGFWNPHRGITRDLSLSFWAGSTKELKNVVWPGDCMMIPKGWTIPPSGSLRVGVPWKPGFREFVNADIVPATNETRATGFAIDMFLYALNEMSFTINYTFLIYNESTDYGIMLRSIPEKYDMIVADTTIWAPRASYVDFSLPYSESGVVFVVKNNKPRNIWIFFMPFSLHMWLAIAGASVIMGCVVWILEYLARRRRALVAAQAQQAPVPALVPAQTQAQQEQEQEQEQVPALVPVPAQELAQPQAPLPAPQEPANAPVRIALFIPIAALAFPETALVKSKTALVVLVCWMFSAFAVMQSYTANLSAILTLDQLQFPFSNDHYIGYHEGSFTKEILTDRLNIRPKRLRSYVSPAEYHAAMCKGSKNGGIDVIFDELPYMKLLLNRYYGRYKIYGPTIRTDGLGFAFSIGSPLVAHFSRAILNVTQGSNMIALEQKNFGMGYSPQDPMSNAVPSQGASVLTPYDFYGLFIILGVISALALACSLMDVFNKLKNWGKDLYKWFRRYININGGRYVPVPQGVEANGEIPMDERDQLNHQEPRQLP